jgi:hypothetical protein
MSKIRLGRTAFVSLAISLFASSAMYAGATPHMITFGGISMNRGQSARINVSVGSPDLMPAGATNSVTVSFSIYEVAATDRAGVTTLRFLSRQSTQVSLTARDGVALDLNLPAGGPFVVSGVVVDNPDFRTPTNVSATFEIRQFGLTLMLNPGTTGELVPAVLHE